MGKIIDGFPWWGQLVDPDPTTGRPDVMAGLDCGEECASIWIARATGKYTDAADLRRSLGHPDGHGETTPDEVARLLKSHGVVAESFQIRKGYLKGAVRAAIDTDQPLVMLGTWIAPNTLHWIVAIGYGNGALIALDPWRGRVAAYSWKEVGLYATGDVVRSVQ